MTNPTLSALRWLALCLSFLVSIHAEERMDEMWGESTVKLRAADAEKGQLFDKGNYAMFIHWGLYSQLANKVDGKTYYGIGEWIMNPRMANIPPEQYKKLAGEFNPTRFDVKAIARLAKDAGMKYVIITSKHHDGFAMYDSAACDFNVVDATPWKMDPMKELAAACRELGLGFGFYYSHNQDWTFPGGGGGPKLDAEGKPASFDDYFLKKCLPQVEEITSQYGPIELVWFDTPGRMPKKYAEQLVAVVRKNQPKALVSGRVGHGLGDYQSLGDMEVPHRNIEGMWESVDTTNDSWAYAWYDECWKTPDEILRRLISCVARGGTYMLNIGPRGDGSVPERAARSLRESGAWIHRYPQVVYDTASSPWKHALPWGDVTVKGKRLFLSVFDWPASGKLYLPGLETRVVSAKLLDGKSASELTHERLHGWTVVELPARAPERLVSVIELALEAEPVVDTTFGLDPNGATTVLAEFAEVAGAKGSKKHWMEKFGEWKTAYHIHQWKPESSVTFEVEVLAAGDYMVDLNYAGEGRYVWSVGVVGGERIQNQQNSSAIYQDHPIGWLRFPQPGKHKVEVKCVDGNLDSASLRAIRFTPVF